MNEEKIQSPHAALQNVLQRLGTIGAYSEWRPAFRERTQAENLIAVVASAEGKNVNLSPIWSIDHDDLTESRIVGWTVTDEIN